MSANALFFVGVAAIFLQVGRIVQRRNVPVAARGAGLLFATWWYALSGLALQNAVTSALAVAGSRDALLYALLLHAGNLLQTVALWALLYYLVFLYTGRRWPLWPLTLVYGATAAGLVAYLQATVDAQSPGVKVDRWSAGLDLEIAQGDPILQLLLALLVLPQLVALLAYFSLGLRATDREARFRAFLVSTSLFVWLAGSYLASATSAGESVLWPVLARALALGAALAVWLAFQPPLAIRGWLERRPGDGQARAFLRRAHELI